jgi:PAS domain S-box-containing protein
VQVKPAGVEPLLEAAGQGVLVLDEDGRIALANARITELFGYRAEELRGHGGRIEAPPAGGTTVVVTLPVEGSVS